MARTTSKTLASERVTLASVSAAGTVGSIVAEIPANPAFTTVFNPRALSGIRPTRIVIVSQDPAPGDFVPAGTPVTVTVVEKGLIPPRSFNGLTQGVVEKFPTISALEEDLNKANDPIAKGAKAVLDKGVAFNQLSDADKVAVTAFVGNRGIAGTDPAKAASDIAFLFHL